MVLFDFGDRIFCKKCATKMVKEDLKNGVLSIKCPSCGERRFHRKGDRIDDV
jgi:DNA-directed RNA polymerase subunit RPC12/RpoP